MGQRQIPVENIPSTAVGLAGLSSNEVAAQQRSCGLNVIVPQETHRWRAILRDTARDPMLWFLVLTAGLFGLLGEVSEAIILAVAVVPLLGMDVWLHTRTVASSAGLASRLATSARVSRDGRWQDVASQELVPGDLVEVKSGDYFPADGVLVSGSNLQVDNSTLTGESLPVVKRVFYVSGQLPASAPDESWAVAGTRLLTGTAWLRIVDTGRATRYGEIVRTATQAHQATTPLQKAIARLVTVLLVVSLLVCVILAVVRVWLGYGWIDALMSAVTLAVAAIPEEFPVVYTFFLGVGVFRLARKNALVRRGVAVENIGRVTTILSDKTGTLTEGSLVLSQCKAVSGLHEQDVLQVASCAARADSGDPLDQALYAAGAPLPQATRQADFPFTEARRRETSVWLDTAGNLVAYTKGAPETVMALCDLVDAQRAIWLSRVEEQAKSGRKVIACARKKMPAGSVLSTEPDNGFAFAGLLAFEDPVRDGVPEAVADCLAAGIRVIMVTGDHPVTAMAVARLIGLGGDDPNVLVLKHDDNPEVAFLSLGEGFAPDVVARATPVQKLALVRLLQAQGEIVAVTGDGINDVPALREADIGIAMGSRGTRSAREAAPVVLMDDNFRTIVDAIREGRQLFYNLRLAFVYLLLAHMPLVMGAAIIPLLGLPLLFLPVHIVWLELVIHPTAMLAFQNFSSHAELAQVQHHDVAQFFSLKAWLGIGLVGGVTAVAVIGCYFHALGSAYDVEHARAMAMAVLLAASTGFTAGLSRLRGSAVRLIVCLTLGSLIAFVQIPTLSALLNLRPLHLADWLLAMVAFFFAFMMALVVLFQWQPGHDQTAVRVTGH